MQQSPEGPQALSRQELPRLEEFLQSQTCGGEPLTLSRAHGFLTALVSGPGSVEPEHWIDRMLDEPVHGESQPKDIPGLIVRLYHSVARSLPLQGGFSPLLDLVQRSDGTLAYRAEEWCRGYLSATALWDRPPPARVSSLLEPLFLIHQPRTATEQQFRDAHYEKLCAMLPRAAEAVYGYWHGGEPDP